MTPGRTNKVGWIGILVYVLSACFATHAVAQDTSWEKKWDPGIGDKWFKDDKTDPKNPKHKLAPVCPDCQKEADKLQAALDDWYLLQFLDGEQIRKDGLAKQDGDQQAAGNACKANALAGLGLSEKEVKEKLKPPKKGEPPKPPLPDKKTVKAKIDELAKKLQECLDECNKPKKITPTPTPTPDDGKQPGTGATEKPPDLPTPIKLPAPPECFNTEAERKAFIDKWQPIANDQGVEARKAREIYNLKDAKAKAEPWGVYWQKKEAIHKASADALQKIIDDADDKTKTPVPCPKTGGGGSKPTPTPKGKPKKQRTTTGHNISFDDGGAGLSEDFCALISENKIRIDDTFGTGETIGHVADLVIENLTDQPIEVTIPPMVLESRSRKNQHYGSRGGDTVEVPPHSKKKVPLDGICLARNKPPVGKDVGGDLAINDCDPDVHISHDEAHRMMRIAESKYDAADKLEEDGKLKDMPYRDPKKRKDIVVQWSTWADPRISEITGAPPATKDDLKKTVYKQAEEQGPVTPDKKKKLDDGIDTLWDKIELTTEKAKELEKPEEDAGTPPGANNVSDNTPTPPPAPLWAPKFPGTEEKAKPDWPPPVQKWIDKKRIADSANKNKEAAHKDYAGVLRKFFQKSRHYNDLKNQRTAAAEDFAENGNKEDKAKFDAADKELKKLEGELEKDFLKTPEGQAEFKKMTDVDKAADQANAEEKEAGKNLDKATKDAVQKAEAEKHPEKKAAADDD